MLGLTHPWGTKRMLDEAAAHASIVERLAELEQQIDRNTLMMEAARAKGFEIETKPGGDGLLLWIVPDELVADTGYQVAVVRTT